MMGREGMGFNQVWSVFMIYLPSTITPPSPKAFRLFSSLVAVEVQTFIPLRGCLVRLRGRVVH